MWAGMAPSDGLGTGPRVSIWTIGSGSDAPANAPKGARIKIHLNPFKINK